MGVNCSLLIKNVEGRIREIPLDRYYVFSSIENINKFINIEILTQEIKGLINLGLRDDQSKSYNSYWIGYAIGCLEQICDKDTIQVGIFQENCQEIEDLYYAKQKLNLKYDTKEYLFIE